MRLTKTAILLTLVVVLPSTGAAQLGRLIKKKIGEKVTEKLAPADTVKPTATAAASTTTRDTVHGTATRQSVSSSASPARVPAPRAEAPASGADDMVIPHADPIFDEETLEITPPRLEGILATLVAEKAGRMPKPVTGAGAMEDRPSLVMRERIAGYLIWRQQKSPESIAYMKQSGYPENILRRIAEEKLPSGYTQKEFDVLEGHRAELQKYTKELGIQR